MDILQHIDNSVTRLERSLEDMHTRNHELKRMFEALGAEHMRLKTEYQQAQIDAADECEQLSAQNLILTKQIHAIMTRLRHLDIDYPIEQGEHL